MNIGGMQTALLRLKVRVGWGAFPSEKTNGRGLSNLSHFPRMSGTNVCTSIQCIQLEDLEPGCWNLPSYPRSILSNSMASDILLNFLDLSFPIVKYLLVQKPSLRRVIFELKPNFETNLDVNFWKMFQAEEMEGSRACGLKQAYLFEE